MQKDIVLLTEVLGLAGMMILENGGDTHRAEETAERICIAAGRPGSDVLALPTGIMISISPCETIDAVPADQTESTDFGSDFSKAERRIPVSIVRRVKVRTINLARLEGVNSAARAFTDGKATLSETLQALRNINLLPNRNRYLSSVYSGISCGLFSLLFGGGWLELIISFVCGFAVQLITSSFRHTNVFQFAKSLVGGIVIAALAVLAATIIGAGNINTVIIGSLLPLLPGLAMINAIRDAMTGDLVSGVARLTDVLIIAFSLAGGVAIVLYVFIALGGSMR